MLELVRAHAQTVTRRARTHLDELHHEANRRRVSAKVDACNVVVAGMQLREVTLPILAVVPPLPDLVELETRRAVHCCRVHHVSQRCKDAGSLGSGV
jgi:hypothetical protein